MNEQQTLLLVDDSEDNLLLMREALNTAKCNHLLREVHNGEEAIAYLRGEGAYSDRDLFPLPAVMLLDLNMPKLNGFAVLSWVRAQPGLKRLTIIVLTASPREEDVERVADLGANAFLVKPISLDALTSMMRWVCDWTAFSCFPPLRAEKTNEKHAVREQSPSQLLL
jgi:CheY-like chemotaxis protein